MDRAELAVHPNAGQRAELGRRLESARRQGLGVEAGNIESESRRIKAGGRPASEDEVEILTAAYRALYDEPAPPPERLRDLFGGQERLWEDRLGRAEEAEADRSVGAQIERCLVLEWRRHEAGDLGASEYDVARRSLHLFRDWVGADRPLQALDGDRFEGWWGHLLGPALSRELKLLLHPVRS